MASTTSLPPPTTRSAPASAEELTARLVSDVPVGFRLQPYRVGDTGPSDLAKAASDDGAPGAAQTLSSEGFVRGYQRLWVGPDRAQIILFVYQFASTAGAGADFARNRSRLSSEKFPGASPFAVDGMPAGQSTAIEGTVRGFSAAIVQFTTGVFVAQVVCNGPVLVGLKDRAVGIAKAQYDRL